MKAEQVKALFLLAGLEVKHLTELPNGYWPDNEYYAPIRRESPWWLVHTELGLIKIGWRKRVISIDWALTGVNVPKLTGDDVTQTETLVHAYSYHKALEYLTDLRRILEATLD